MIIIKSLVTLLISTSLAHSIEVLPTIIVEPEERHKNPVDDLSTFKVERVSSSKAKEPQRHTLSDLVKDQIGVDTQTYCANCGAKRLTINGLKGEHTSILIDGLPLHSATSSFYGVDTIPINGIQDIEVMRGAGASLTNPESIGGTINLITLDPMEQKQSYFSSIGLNDQSDLSSQNHAFLASGSLIDKILAVSLGGQYSKTNAWDENKNNVSESPQRENQSFLVKTKYLPNSKNSFNLRLSLSQLEILGGSSHPSRPQKVRETPAQETDFENGNVEKKFIGLPLSITDWVNLSRYEAALHWTHHLSQKSTLNWSQGYARQEQKSIYQHGFDYSNKDHMYVSDLHLQTLYKNDHLIKAGVFYKNQKLRSASDVLFTQKSLPKDNLNHYSYAAYLQDTVLFSDSLELDLALRIDQIEIDWIELTNKINETIFSPRVQIRHNLNEHLTQRVSYGLGYRSPLTFFESQHGNEESGYKIHIQSVEKAHSLVYSLSQNTPNYYVTASAHYTNIQNMAYGEESPGGPILYKNTDETYDVWAKDLLVGYKIFPWWFLEGSIEFFKYQDSYTKKLPTAAIERRTQLKSSVDYKNWSHEISANFIGSRDLSKYGNYADHYQDRNQFPPPETKGTHLKRQKAPGYFTLDTSLSYETKNKWSFSLGITNLFNYTQTKVGDSPSTWHWHYDHAHFDGLHTWGPNRGREYHLKVSKNF